MGVGKIHSGSLLRGGGDYHDSVPSRAFSAPAALLPSCTTSPAVQGAIDEQSCSTFDAMQLSLPSAYLHIWDSVFIRSKSI